MLPGLKVGNSSSDVGALVGTRKSERSKKPSSSWNEEAGFVVEPPRSAKKKALRGDLPEGMPSNPLHIADWSNAQLVNYCSASGIMFNASALHEDACLDYICKVEKNRALACVIAQGEHAETSCEVRGQ